MHTYEAVNLLTSGPIYMLVYNLSYLIGLVEKLVKNSCFVAVDSLVCCLGESTVCTIWLSHLHADKSLRHPGLTATLLVIKRVCNMKRTCVILPFSLLSRLDQS